MKSVTVPIDQAGRLVLPKKLRQELALRPGDKFLVSLQGTTVTLTPANQTTGFVRKGKALVFSAAGSPTLERSVVDTLLEEQREEGLERHSGTAPRQ